MTPSTSINLDRTVHLINAAALIIAGLYFVFRMEANNDLMAHQMATLNAHWIEHRGISAHPEQLVENEKLRADIRELTNNVNNLLDAVKLQHEQIERLEGEMMRHATSR